MRTTSRNGDPRERAIYVHGEKYYRVRAAHHDALRRKYESAARHPWLPVPPDPPEPN